MSIPIPSTAPSLSAHGVSNLNSSAISHTPFQLSGNVEKDALIRQQTFQFGGKNSVAVDQGGTLFEKTTDKTTKNVTLAAELEKKIADKEADLKKFKNTHWASFAFDPLGVSSWTRTLKREKAGMENEIAEFKSQKAGVDKEIERDNKLLDKLSGSLATGVQSNLLEENKRLGAQGSDNITANTRLNGAAGGYVGRLSY